MLRRKETPGDGPGAAHRQNAATGRKCLVMPYFTTKTSDLSSLVDQAQERAHRDRLLAAFYARRGRKHRRILVELRKLAEVKT